MATANETVGGAKRRAVEVDGVVLIDKPSGITSNAALQRARRLLNAAKAGHTGTLDPLATGLLPVCLGEATKFSGLLLDADKTYLADIQFGVTTTTGDAEGELLERGDTTTLTRAAIEATMCGLLGTMEQVPPMYSALKHKGRALYEYARAGETVERASRRIQISEIAPLQVGADWVRVRMRVSKGTYVRTVAEEAGRRLGCGGYLKALRREATGGLNLEDGAVTLEALEAMNPLQRLAHVLPVDVLVAGLPRVDLDEDAARALQQGRQVAAPPHTPQGLLRLYEAPSRFLGVGSLAAGERIAPRRLLRHPPAASAAVA
jgi:tRNA pseudouridine55 synthase